MHNEALELIKNLQLTEHPEGGYYKETYRSKNVIPQQILGESFNGARNYCTSIYFLLTSDRFSAFHRIQQDEIWNFHKGSPLTVHVIDNSGNYTQHLVGLDLKNGQTPQFVVPAGCWFASSVNEKNHYSFVGCTVAPGFDFNDFELADRGELIQEYPKLSEVITRLTR